MTLLKCIQEGGARETVKKEIIYVKGHSGFSFGLSLRYCHQPLLGTRCTDIFTDPHIPSLDGGWN